MSSPAESIEVVANKATSIRRYARLEERIEEEDQAFKEFLMRDMKQSLRRR